MVNTSGGQLRQDSLIGRTGLIEDDVEQIALRLLAKLGYSLLFGPHIAPGENIAERDDYSEVVLKGRLKSAMISLNKAMPKEAVDDAFRKVMNPDSPSLVLNNRSFHRVLINGVEVEYRRKDGSIAGNRVRLVDFENPANNDWLAVNQFTVVEGQVNRRPDIVIFLNGLPIAVFELKNPADERADIWKAYAQLQTYREQIPALFTCNELLVVSDGLKARFGSLTANKEWFHPWRSIEGQELAPFTMPELEVLIRGMFEPRRLLQLLRYFVVFDDDGSGKIEKKIAGYHQFHAVNQAIESTLKAVGVEGDRRCGVVWHTQGSGKSLTMAFFAGAIIATQEMRNPTIVVITDRNDLDDQLFGTFSRCSELLHQSPQQADSREHLKELLRVASGGVVFTTIQKFFPADAGVAYPELSDRRNIIVIADEAHRSQYGFVKGDIKGMKLGLATHMRSALPNASFIGFTGTPIEFDDKNTQAVFGDYISIYDIQRAVEDKATVPIYYESRLANLELNAQEKPHLDPDFEEITEGEGFIETERYKTKWTAIEALVGTEKRTRLIAEDFVRHFEERISVMEGKALFVCMSRRICVALYDEIVKLRPEWEDDEDARGTLKIVMTGNATDDIGWHKHTRSKQEREKLAIRFKDENDPFKIAIVCSMWLTGFDCPSMHTMYLDKPMGGHNLMQAIARVNRVFKDKPGGLVVDYLGLADKLKKALARYTDEDRKNTAIDQEQAVSVMLEKYEICEALFHGFDRSDWKSPNRKKRLDILPPAQEFILAQDDGKKRLMKAVKALSQAFALSVPHTKALEIREDVGFFQAVRAALVKSDPTSDLRKEQLNQAINQLVSKAISSDEVIDVFQAAGLKKPNIQILSDEFLEEVKGMEFKNLALETLRKLILGEIRIRMKKNVVEARKFSEMLEKALQLYKNRAIEAAKIIEHLIEIAKQLREAGKRGEQLGLKDDELAFYDALETNDSAVKVLGDKKLREIARLITKRVKANATIDWTIKESVRAKLRRTVKRVLRKYGYPPDKQEKATEMVIEQAKALLSDVRVA